MSQLIKHYYINRETNTYALNTKFGLMLPNIKGLDIIHTLADENDIPYCLSTCPEYFEYNTTVSGEVLQELESRPNITVVSSSEVSVEEETLYNVVYQEAYILEETEGLWVITQTDWDNEIDSYDSRQKQKRFKILRSICEEILSASDWVVIKSLEKEIDISQEFKFWRQSLRDLPDQEGFPSQLPQIPSEILNPSPIPGIPSEVQNDSKVLNAYSRWGEVTSIPMINDPTTQTEVI